MDMNEIFFTITGFDFHYGKDVFEKGQIVRLEKEPDNKFDKEAIKVMLPGLGHCGYVANSWRTVLGDSFSAGRLYDRIGNVAEGEVQYVTEKGIVCTLILTIGQMR